MKCQVRCFEEASEKLETLGIDVNEFLSCVCEDLVGQSDHDHEVDLINQYLEQRFDL